MTQTKKRLAIIKLAISMTDTETIQLQVLKLGLLKTDSRMRDILSTLNAHNYAHAQKLISEYIEYSEESTIVQRTSQKEQESKKSHNSTKSIIDEKEENFPSPNTALSIKEKIEQAKAKALVQQSEECYDIDMSKKNESIENYGSSLETTPEPKNVPTENINYDALLNIDAEDILADNITLDINDLNSYYPDNNEENIEEKSILNPKKSEDIPYVNISYIDQKLAHMTKQYPPIEECVTKFPSVDAWLHKIAHDGYLESEVDEMLKYIDTIIPTDKAEAAQLLLITAATQSKYAQFKFARALYKGEIIQKNISESFTLIHRLAMNDNYPEAICDLAQFYENGIAIEEDKSIASELYKEAMDLGVTRAMRHYERLHTKKRGLLSLFKK